MSYDHLLNRLETVLKKNIALYSAMESVLREEETALTAHDLIPLEAIIKGKNGVTAKLAALESDRVNVVKDLAEATNTPLAEFTLTRLLDEVSPERKTELASLQKRLRERVTRTEELNSFNRGVIEKLMKINHASASNLQDLMQPNGGYGPGGVPATRLKSGRIVSRTL